MSADPRTIKTYDDSAEAMAEHFQHYKEGVAREEIEQAFALTKRPHVARIVEIGCGAGKDATELMRHTDWYEGFDPSAKLLAIAREHVPEASFVQADALSYKYPADVDMVFAFASLLHLNRDDFKATCSKVAHSLKTGGVFCMVLKQADKYTEHLQEDEFGTRLFYLYTPQLVCELVGKSFELRHEAHATAGARSTRWMTLIFVKS